MNLSANNAFAKLAALVVVAVVVVVRHARREGLG